MLGLDIIGAGESLAAYTILVKVRSVDADKLRAAITDKPWGGAIPGALTVVDSAPKLVLEVGLPIAKAQLEKIGIVADLSTTQKAPKAGGPHEMVTVLGVGAVLGFVLALAGRSLYHLFVSPAVKK